MRSSLHCFVLVLAVLSSFELGGCGEEEPPPPPPPPTVLDVRVVDSTTSAPIAGAEVVLLDVDGKARETDAQGAVKLEVAPGRHRARVQAAGYLGAPEPAREPPSVVAPAEKTTEMVVQLEPRPGAVPGGIIRGRVTRDGAPVRDALVLAQATVDFAALTDSEGRYALLGVPPNLYEVTALAKGSVNAAPKNVQVRAGEAKVDVDLALTAAAGAAVGGMIGQGTGTTSVALALAGTGDLVPGLVAVAQLGGSYRIEGVPPGRYLVRAMLERDGFVLDPELVRLGRTPVIEIRAETATASVDLPSAPAMEGVRPTGGSTTAAPVVFSWDPVPGADFYVIEVQNLLGQVIWGGFDRQLRSPSFRILGRTSIPYGEQFPPLQPLQSGALYQWRVYAGKNDPSQLFVLLRASEELEGRFRVAR